MAFVKGKLFFILDNLVKCDDIEDFFVVQGASSNVYALATTQTATLRDTFNCYPLPKLNEENSDALLNSILGGKMKSMRNDFEDLYELLDGLPLALVHAAATINCTINILLCIAYLNPDDIHIDYLKEGFNIGNHNVHPFEKELLIKYPLITKNSDKLTECIVSARR